MRWRIVSLGAVVVVVAVALARSRPGDGARRARFVNAEVGIAAMNRRATINVNVTATFEAGVERRVRFFIGVLCGGCLIVHQNRLGNSFVRFRHDLS
jgi:hypothetical protein